MTDAEADAFAKSRGFKDYATMLAWHRQRQAAQGSQGASKPRGNALARPMKPEEAQEATRWHPAMLLEWVSRKMGEAGL